MTDYALSYQPLACESQFLLVFFMCNLTMLVDCSIVGEPEVCHCAFSLLIMPVLGSPGCEWLWYLAEILAC